MIRTVDIDGLDVIWDERDALCTICHGTGKPRPSTVDALLGMCARCIGSGREHEAILRDIGRRRDVYVGALLNEIRRLRNDTERVATSDEMKRKGDGNG